MKSFKEYLRESINHQVKDTIPHGVVIHGDKIFVGVNHGTQISIGNNKILDRIKSIGSKSGYFYEGNGGEVKQNIFGLKSKKDYKGGWDEDRKKSIKKTGIQPHNFSIIYSNVNHNWDDMTQHFHGKTVFDGILSWAQSKSSEVFGGAKIDSSHIEHFLKTSSHGTDSDFLKMSKETHISGSKDMLRKIEKIAWPSDWDTRKRTAGPELLVDKESRERNSYIIDHMGSGVYIAGSGHLKQIADILNHRKENFEFHGGSKI